MSPCFRSASRLRKESKWAGRWGLEKPTAMNPRVLANDMKEVVNSGGVVIPGPDKPEARNPKECENSKLKRRPSLSFPRRRESSLFKLLWTPASAGVTTWRRFHESTHFDYSNFVLASDFEIRISSFPPTVSAEAAYPD